MGIKLRKRKIRGGNETLYLDHYDHGRRHLEYLNLYLTGDRKKDKLTLELAEDILAKRRLEVVREEHEFPSPEKQQADFITYARQLTKKKRSPNTRLAWENAIVHLERFAGSPLPFSRLTESFLERFRDHLLEAVAQNSAQAYLARIKTAINQAVREKILLRNPGTGVLIKKATPKRRFLTLEELRKLEQTECTNRAVKDAFLFSAFCGLRYSDVRALTWDQVNRSGPHTTIELTVKKTGEPERLPLSRQAAKILHAQKGAEYSPHITGELVPNAAFKMPAQQTVDKAIKRWVKRAGINKRISFHCARHTFATLGITQGVDIYVMSKLLGHRDLASTQIYAKIVDKKKQEAVNLFPTLD